MEKEYKVVIYDKNTKLEEYEYFDNEKESIEYAKEESKCGYITSVYCCEYCYETDFEETECIWESEE